MHAVFAVAATVLALGLAAPLAAEESAAAAWQTGQQGNTHFASAAGSAGLAATLSFQKGRAPAQLVITGLWPTEPLKLRLKVTYATGRTIPLDTYRFAEILEISGKPAYKLDLSRAALRPLKGGDTLVIEDLSRRAEIPLTGSAKAINAAEAAAGS